MITVEIGESKRDLEDASPDWINQQINRRRRDSSPVCVRVCVKCGDIDLVTSTPACPRGGGGRKATERELKVFELWEKRGLHRENLSGGNLVAFLQQIEDLVGPC